MCGDFQNFNTLIIDKYPELVEYWLEIYHVMIRQQQRIEDLKTDNLKLQGLNDTLINIVKTYNLVGLNQYGRKEERTEAGNTGRQKSMPEVKPAKKKQTVKKNRVHDTEKADNKASKVSIETIRRLASHGLTIEQIGCFFGFDEKQNVFTELCEKHPEYLDAFNEGKALGIDIATSCLFQQMENGNSQSTIFYLKAKAGWSDTQKIEMKAEVKTNRVEDMTMDELLALKGRLENESENSDTE